MSKVILHNSKDLQRLFDDVFAYIKNESDRDISFGMILIDNKSGEVFVKSNINDDVKILLKHITNENT